MTEYQYIDLGIKIVIANALVAMLPASDVREAAEEEIMDLVVQANEAYDREREPYAAGR